ERLREEDQVSGRLQAPGHADHDDRLVLVTLSDALLELQGLTERLRRDCPWDRGQTVRTIVPHTLEEAYEVADAAEQGDDAKLLDELGDLLFQVYFLSLLLAERGQGDLERGVGGRSAETEPDRAVAGEVGDVLFAAVNVARHLNVDPELSLRTVSDRFVARVEQAERLAAAEGRRFDELPLAQQDEYFDRAKETLR